ncbi:hypothetical protein ZWY2020_018103 [Hordeum vulgare]|nr:hypothetical protein ZWY2020_018103 [Hordeum vulgare]
MNALSARKCSEFFCGFVVAAFAVYALVIAISTFNTSSSSTASTCAAPPPASPSDGCDKDKMRNDISMLVRCLVSAQTCSLLLIFFVRAILESAQAAHDRVAKDEDAAHKAANDALNVANEKLLTLRRRLDGCSEKVRQRLEDGERWAALAIEQQLEKNLVAEVDLARQHADRTKPKEGMDRITGPWRTAVRVSFFLSVFFSQVAAVIARFAFYYSLKIEENCKFGGFVEIIAFSCAFICSLSFHVFFAWVSITGY